MTDYLRRTESRSQTEPIRASESVTVKGSPMLHEYGDGEHFNLDKISKNQEKFFAKLSRVGYPEWKIIFEKNTKNSSDIAKILDGLYQYCLDKKYEKRHLINIFRLNIATAIVVLKNKSFREQLNDSIDNSELKALINYTKQKFDDERSRGAIKKGEEMARHMLAIQTTTVETDYEKPAARVSYDKKLITERVSSETQFKIGDIPDEVDVILKSYPYSFYAIFTDKPNDSNFWGNLLIVRMLDSSRNINSPDKWKGAKPTNKTLINYINTHAYFEGKAVESIYNLLQDGKPVSRELLKEAVIEIKKKTGKSISENRVLDYVREKKGFGANTNYFVKKILKGELKDFEVLSARLKKPLNVEMFYPDENGKKTKTFTFNQAMVGLYHFLKNADNGPSLELKFLEEILSEDKKSIDFEKIKSKLKDPDSATREYNYKAFAYVLLKSASFSAGLKIKTPETQIKVATFEETFMAGDVDHFKGFEELKRKINTLGDDSSENDIKDLEKELKNTRNYLATVIENSKETLSRPAEQQIKTNLLYLMTKLEELLAFKKHLIKEEKAIRSQYMKALKEPVEKAMKEVGVVRRDGKLVGLKQLYIDYLDSTKQSNTLETFNRFMDQSEYSELKNSSNARNIRLILQFQTLEDPVTFEKINGETKKIELLNSDTKVFCYQNIIGTDPSKKVYSESTDYQLDIIPQYLSKLEKLDAYEQEYLSEALIREDVNIEVQDTAKPLGGKVKNYLEQSLDNVPGSIYFEFTQQKNSNNIFGPQGKIKQSYSHRTIDFANAVIDSINGRAEKLAWKIDNMLNKNFNKEIILKNKAAVRLKSDLIVGDNSSQVKEEFKTDSLTIDDLIAANRHDLILEKLNMDRNFKVLLNCIENDKKIPSGLMEVLPEEIKRVLSGGKDKSEKLKELLDIFRTTRPFLNKEDRNKLVDKLLADWNQRESILGTESNKEKLNAKAEAQLREKQMTVRIVNADKLVKKLKERYKRGN